MDANHKQIWKTHLEALIDRMKQVADDMENVGTFKKSLNISSDEMEAAYALGYQFYKQQKYDKAMTIFQGLFLLDPFSKEYAQAIAATFKAQGQIADAGVQYITTYLAHPEDLSLALMACRCMAEVGNEIQACYILSGVIDAGRFPKDGPNKFVLNEAKIFLDALEKIVDKKLNLRNNENKIDGEPGTVRGSTTENGK
jgi:TolA-binding protein